MATAAHVLSVRLARHAIFESDLVAAFGEPAYDMVLAIYIAAATGQPVSVSKALSAAGLSQATGLRCIQRLVAIGAVVRTEDPRDRRRSFVALTERTAQSLERHLSSLARPV